MKKILSILILMLFFCLPVCAIEKEIKAVLKTNLKYANKYNFEGISKLYTPEFVNNDGFDREVYFKLIQDTWKTYPKIIYTSKIKNISGNEKYARVEVYETASAVIDDNNGFGSAELFSAANSIYFLEKIGSDWLITAEQIVDEKSFLRYGDAKAVKMDLTAPALVDAGKNYTALLSIDAPRGAAIIASVSNAKITYPQVKPEDVFRRLPEDNVLERMFSANKDSVNEYAVASVGIAGVNEKNSKGGLAFIMTRVNVVPANKFVGENEE
jgi:hypothetical protein